MVIPDAMKTLHSTSVPSESRVYSKFTNRLCTVPLYSVLYPVPDDCKVSG